MFDRRRRPSRRPIYLVSAAGLPNYGDEVITRAWLDWLATNHPQVPVWLDCPEPGRANHLFRGVHPDLTTTNTLWHLAISAERMTLTEGVAHAERLVEHLGSPRFDLGLLQLRDMGSVHLLGGGYLTSVWENQLTMLPALVALKRLHKVPIYASGQGLAPLSAEARELVPGWVRQFDLFEARDAVSAELSGALPGIDDAFLAFANPRPVYSGGGTPDVMVVMQGDFVSEDGADPLVETVDRFIRKHAGENRVGLVESIPPDDSWIRGRLEERGIDVEFFPFVRLWDEGFPARPGQTWLASRFHFHLLAAAAGARGAVVELHPEYYGVKHESLRRLGTGWGAPDGSAAATSPVPAVDPSFPQQVDELARRKVRTARAVYG